MIIEFQLDGQIGLLGRAAPPVVPKLRDVEVEHENVLVPLLALTGVPAMRILPCLNAIGEDATSFILKALIYTIGRNA